MKDGSRHALSNAPRMPVIYRFGRRINPIFWIGFHAVLGSLFSMPTVVWLFGVIEVIGKRPVTAEDFAPVSFYVVFSIFGLLMFWGVWTFIKDSTYEVRLHGDRVEFRWVLGTIRVPVSSIRAITRLTFVSDEGEPRAIVLRHARGTITIRYFPDIDDLIQDLARANPSLAVTGGWRA